MVGRGFEGRKPDPECVHEMHGRVVTQEELALGQYRQIHPRLRSVHVAPHQCQPHAMPPVVLPLVFR